MAIETVTIAQLESEIKWNLTTSDSASTTLMSRVRFRLSMNMKRLAARSDRWMMRTEATISLVDGTADYGLPDLYHKMDGTIMTFADDNTRFIRRLSDHEYKHNQGIRVFATEDRPGFFTIVNRDSGGIAQARFFPTPDASYTANYVYFAVPTTIIGAADSTVMDARVPEEFHEILVLQTTLDFPDMLTRDVELSYFRKMRRLEQEFNTVNEDTLGQFASDDRFKVPFGGRGRAFIWPPNTLS